MILTEITYTGGVVASTVPRVAEGLATDKIRITANGIDAATLHYAQKAAGAHTWSVNDNDATAAAGAPQQDPATGLWWTSITVTSAAPRTITVAVSSAANPGESTVITAV